MGFKYIGYNVAGIALDATDPNTAPPSSERVFTPKPTPMPSNDSKIHVFVADGTSLAVEAWVKDPSDGRWWKLGASTITASSGKGTFDVIGGLPHFIRVTANTGTVTRYSVAT